MKRSKLVLLIGGCLLTALASWSMLSESTLDAKSYADQEYEELKKEAATNTNKLFIEYLFQKPNSSWSFNLKRAFKEGKITPNDLLFIAKGTNFNNPIEPTSPISIAILYNLKHPENVAAIIKLLSEPQIDLSLGYWGPDLKLSFLAALVQNNYIKAFETIIEWCPHYDHNPFSSAAVLATSMVDDPENLGTFRNGKKPETVGYSLASWLMRDEQKYLLGKYTNPSYVKAGQALLLFAKDRAGLEMSHVGIVPLAQFFKKHKLLPEGFDYNSFAQLKGIPEEVTTKELEAPAPIVPVAENEVAPQAPTPADPEAQDSEDAKPFYRPLLEFIGL